MTREGSLSGSPTHLLFKSGRDPVLGSLGIVLLYKWSRDKYYLRLNLNGPKKNKQCAFGDSAFGLCQLTQETGQYQRRCGTGKCEVGAGFACHKWRGEGRGERPRWQVTYMLPPFLMPCSKPTFRTLSARFCCRAVCASAAFFYIGRRKHGINTSTASNGRR